MSPAATRLRSTRRSRSSATDPELHWTPSQPSLEDVFIDLMARVAGQLPMISFARSRQSGALARTLAMFIKEFVQLRRDRLTFGTMIFIPVVQLLLFGYAINTTPRHLPTAVLVHEESDLARSILAALSNTSYFAVTQLARSEAEMDHWMRSGDVLFGIEIPAGFERGVRRGDRPALLVAADASDPVAAGTALGALEGVVQHAPWRAIAGCPRPPRRPPPSRSASTAATIPRPSPASISCRVCSAPFSP